MQKKFAQCPGDISTKGNQEDPGGKGGEKKRGTKRGREGGERHFPGFKGFKVPAPQ